MDEGTWVLVVALAAASLFGGWRAARDGRFTGTRRMRRASRDATEAGGTVEEEAMNVLDGAGIDQRLGARATLLQFSSAFCAPCRATRRVLGEVASLVPGVTHVEVDAEHHLDLVRRLGVARTPTTLILDPQGRELSRATGAPRRDEVMTTLAQHLPAAEAEA